MHGVPILESAGWIELGATKFSMWKRSTPDLSGNRKLGYRDQLGRLPRYQDVRGLGIRIDAIRRETIPGYADVMQLHVAPKQCNFTAGGR